MTPLLCPKGQKDNATWDVTAISRGVVNLRFIIVPEVALENLESKREEYYYVLY